MVADLRHSGTEMCRDVLKMSVKMSLSWFVQSLKTHPGMLSGPAALRGLMWDRTLLTLVGVRRRVCSSGRGVAFWVGVMFMASNRASKSFSWSGQEGSLSQTCVGALESVMAWTPCHRRLGSLLLAKLLVILAEYCCLALLIPRAKLFLAVFRAATSPPLKAVSLVFLVIVFFNGYDIIYMLLDVVDDCHSVLLQIHVIVEGGYVSEDVTVCNFHAVL